MIYAPNMLLVGAAGRDAGKTAFAGELLEWFRDARVFGAKVTAIQETGGACPRGGEGCGVCSSLEGPYCLTEETTPGQAKDTQRLLASGAQRVFWLRALKDDLETGVRVLLNAIGDGTPVICESNSVRHAVEPGLFCMVRRQDAKTTKASAKAVQQFTDIVVASDGSRFDFDFDRIGLVDGRWTFRFPATAILLAGGRSTRMGKDKAMLDVGGRPMITHVFEQLRPHFDDVMISTARETPYPFLDVRTVPDSLPGMGPLAGMITALEMADTELNFVVSCDIPRIDVRLIHQLFRAIGDRDMAVPVSAGAHTEPLFALYRKKALTGLHAAWNGGTRDVRGALAACDVAYVPLCDGWRIPNINTPEEYEAFVMERERESHT